jgi:hypothetical protein
LSRRALKPWRRKCVAEPKEATMKALSQTEAPFSQVLLNWMTDRISRTAAAIRPKHQAGQIAADVAAGGNPSGA